MCNIVKKVSQEIYVYPLSIDIPIIDLAPILSVRKSSGGRGSGGAGQAGAKGDRPAGAGGGRSVWVMALFGKGAPPALRTVSDGEVPWIPLDEDQEGG